MLASLTFLLVAPSRPTLTVPSAVAIHGEMFERALDNLLQINTLPFHAGQFPKSGLLPSEGRFYRAGGDYQEPWTRDATVNSWNAGSLLEPDVAQNTLFAVLGRDEKGQAIVQRDNQWWDKVIWVTGAWNHYLTTGDRKFLTTAYGVSSRLLAAMHAERFDKEFGLYQGPSFFNDGIAGYPAPPASPTDAQGSTFVLDYRGTDKLMTLSTNCLYVAAYENAAKMADALGEPGAATYRANAVALKRSINRRLWMPSEGRYGYLLHGDGALRGKLDSTEEGCGLAFAILFDVASPKQAKSILSRTHIDPKGITDTYPHYPRYSDAHPGRHNVVVWPMIQGLWARAATKLHDTNAFTTQMNDLAHLAESSKGNFYEIYDSKTGAVEGGWQSGIHFNSVPNQTWSATAYLSMVLNGIFGMRFDPKGLRFEPLVPNGWSGAKLSGIAYRGATLDLTVKGTGTRLASVKLDGITLNGGHVASNLQGRHTIELSVK